MENIVLIIKILQNNDCANISDEVDILCGKNYLPISFKEGLKQIKRFKNA